MIKADRLMRLVYPILRVFPGSLVDFMEFVLGLYTVMYGVSREADSDAVKNGKTF